MGGFGTFSIFEAGYEVGFGEVGDGLVDAAAAAEAGERDYEGGGHHFVVFTTLFYLCGGLAVRS